MIGLIFIDTILSALADTNSNVFVFILLRSGHNSKTLSKKARTKQPSFKTRFLLSLLPLAYRARSHRRAPFGSPVQAPLRF